MFEPRDSDLLKYRQVFGQCGFLMPDCTRFSLENHGKSYKPPPDETAEKFAQRLEKSINQGENLFLDVYKQFDPYPDKEAVY